MGPNLRRAAFGGLAVVALALVIRFLYLPQIQAAPTFDHPVMDAAYHDVWAREVASGNFTDGEPFFRAPLYPFLLGLAYRLSGDSHVVPRVIQFIMGALTALLTYAIARRLLGKLAALISGLAAAAYPVLVYFEGGLLTETLFVFLIMLSLYLFAVAVDKQRIYMWFLAGLTLGAALITRPTVAVFIPFAVLGALLLSRRRALCALTVAFGVLIMLTPVTLHNFAVSGEFIPLVWQGGLNFYLGNNAAADGWSATSPELRKDWWGGYNDMITIPEQELGRYLHYSDVSDYWMGKGLDYIRSDPGGYMRLVLKKAALFWGSYEFPNNLDYNFMKRYSWVLRNPVLSFATLAPLALLGLIVLAPRARRLYFPYAFFLTFFAGTVAFFVCSRYRAPALPVMMVFAGGSVAWLVDALRARKIRKLVPALIGLGIASAFVSLNPAGEDLPGFAQSYTVFATVYREQGDLDRASFYLEKAIAENPLWGEGYEGLGLIAMERGRAAEAREYLIRAVDAEPNRATAYRSLAMLYLSEGDTGRARTAIEAAIAHAPYLEDNYNIMGSVERQEGNTDGAIESFEREIDLNPGNWRAYANLASVYDEAGNLEEAIGFYERAIELEPGESDLVYALATAYARDGQEERARALMSSLGGAGPESPAFKYNRAVLLQNEGKTEEARALYEEILAADASHEGALVNLGVIYARGGRAEEARALWERALIVNPANQNARRNIDLLNRRPPNGG